MDLTFFSSDKEQMILELIEVKAHTTGETIQELFFLVLDETLIFINYELELDSLFSFEFVLHESPVGDSTI